MLLSLIVGALNGKAADTVNAGITAAQGSVTATLAFAGTMCMWSGIMKIADVSGICSVICKILTPVIKLLFPAIAPNSTASRKITMNITANLLGMGNAATPLGIEAMKELEKTNKSPLYASDEMCTFAVLNTASFQLIPTTIIALRAAAGAQNPSDATVPIWIVSALSLVSAVTAVKLGCRYKGRFSKK